LFARAADFNACGDSVVVVVEVLGKKTLIKKDRSEIECFQVQVADTSGRMVVSFFDGTRGLLLGGWVGDGAFRYWKYLMLRRGSRAYGKFCVLARFFELSGILCFLCRSARLVFDNLTVSGVRCVPASYLDWFCVFVFRRLVAAGLCRV
jgi:hypothetical protein